MVKFNKQYEEEESVSLVREAAVAYNTPIKKIQLSRVGIAPDFVVDLMSSYHFSKVETARLTDISAKTLDRHIQSGKNFTGLQSDRLIDLADLYMEGLDAFGSNAKFIQWLNAKTAALGNTTPKSWLDTQRGISLISDQIGRIKHGIFA